MRWSVGQHAARRNLRRGEAKPSVVIQAMGRFTAYHAARAAEDRGYLRGLVTGRHRRTEEGIPGRLRRHVRFPAYLSYAVARAPAVGNPAIASRVCDAMFDWLASRHAEPVDVFHGFLAYSLQSMKVYRELGAHILIDTGAAHIATEQQLVAEEYQKFKVPVRPMHPAWVQRQLAEYAEADVILVPSSFVRDTHLERGTPGRKLRVVPYGVDTDRFPFARPRLQRGPLRVLFVGTISLEKGVPYLLEACRGLSRRVDLTLVGHVAADGRDVVRKYRDSCRLITNVPNAALHQVIHEHDVLVLPSVQDGSGMVVTEAMACGRPVIVSDHVGAKDFLRRGGGFVVPFRSVAALEVALSSFLGDRGQVGEIGSVAREVIAEFTWARYGKLLCRVYEEFVRCNDSDSR